MSQVFSLAERSKKVYTSLGTSCHNAYTRFQEPEMVIYAWASNNGNLVYELWQEVPKLVHTFWTLQPVFWTCWTGCMYCLTFVYGWKCQDLWARQGHLPLKMRVIRKNPLGHGSEPFVKNERLRWLLLTPWVLWNDRYRSDQNFCRGSTECKMFGGSCRRANYWCNKM